MLQTEHFLPAVRPSSVHVAALASRIISVWPKAATVSCATVTVLQIEHCLPSVRPDSVHVGALASRTTSV